LNANLADPADVADQILYPLNLHDLLNPRSDIVYRVATIFMSAGYSGSPLSKKLGIKGGFAVATVNAPDDFERLLEPIPASVTIIDKPKKDIDLIHFFTNSRDELARGLAKYKDLIRQNGTIWVSWYKKAAKLPTEITEDVVRDVALPLGLVDIKVCAVDEKWSGLKLVIRRENRV
jgi:hypothetical protein